MLNETLRASEEHTVYLEKRVARLERAAETTDAKLEGFAEILANVSSKCSQLETNLNAVNLSLHQETQLLLEELAAIRTDDLVNKTTAEFSEHIEDEIMDARQYADSQDLAIRNSLSSDFRGRINSETEMITNKIARVNGRIDHVDNEINKLKSAATAPHCSATVVPLFIGSIFSIMYLFQGSIY